MTGDPVARLYAKKLLPLDIIKDAFFDYLDERMTDVHARVFPEDGSFLTLTNVTPTAFVDGVCILGAFDGASGEGHTIGSAALNPLFANILFENTAGVAYHIGLRYVLVPDDVEINPRTGHCEYVRDVESVGNVADPNTVTDLVGSLRFIVDSVTEVGVPHIGRTVRVWLKDPVTDIVTSAFEDCAVNWDGFNNYITTGGTLGQQIASPSVNPADYTVHELGATFQRFTSGDLRVTPGVLFLAKITGTGPGAWVPPGNIDMADQKVILWSVSGWLDITRVDAHGDTKIRVTADGLDVNEPQIEVWDAASVQTFSVNEAGDTTIAGDIELDGDLKFQIGGSGVEFPSFGARVDEYGMGGVALNGVSPWGDVSGCFAGFATHDWAVDGSLYLISGFGANIRAGGLLGPSATTLTFFDQYATGGVALSSGLGTGGAVYYGDGSILGGLSEGQALHDSVEGPCVLEGCLPSPWGGLDVSIAAGRLYIYANSGFTTFKFGRLVSWGGWPPLTIPASFAGWIYFPAGSSTPTYNANPVIAFADGGIVIGYVETDLVSVTKLVDLRFFANQKDKSTIVTVGPQIGAYNRCHNFRSLQAAVEWANQVFWLSVGSDDWAPVEIRVCAPVTETATINVQCDGIRITGAPWQQRATVYWTVVGAPLFNIAADHVSIEGLNFTWLGIGAGSGLIGWGATGVPRYGFKFKNNVTFDPNGLEYDIMWSEPLGNAITDVEITGNTFNHTTPSGAVNDYFIRFVDGVNRCRIRDNKFDGEFAASVRFGVKLDATCSTSSLDVSHNQFSSLYLPLLQVGAAAQDIRFDDNFCLQCCVGTFYVSSFSGWYNVHRNNIYDCAIAPIGNPQIRVTGYGARVTENFLTGCTLTGAADISIVGCVNGVIADNVSISGWSGIQLSGCSQCSVTGNTVTSPATRGSFMASTSGHCTISGNVFVGGGNMAPVPSPVVTLTSNYDFIFTGNRVIGANAAAQCLYIPATSGRVTVTGNEFSSSAVVDANYGAVGVWIGGEDCVVTGNLFYDLASAGFGAVGVYVNADDCVVSGNTFRSVDGSAVYVAAGIHYVTIDGNVIRSCGLAAILNPLVGIVQTDCVYVYGADCTVIGNTILPAVAGGFGVTFAVGSANNVGQCNRVNAATKVQDLAGASFIAAPVFPASNNF